MNPEFNIEQFRRSKDLTYPDPEDNVPSIDMRHRAEQSEWLMLQEILHDRLLLFRAGPDDKLPTKGLPSYWGLLERVPPKAMKRIMLDSQFVSTMPGNAKFETGEYLNAECLRRLSKSPSPIMMRDELKHTD